MRRFLLFIAVLAMFASCVRVEVFRDKVPTNTKGEYAILFGNHTPLTKASITSVSGTGYDEFKLFTWNSINDTIMNPFLVTANGAGSYNYEGVNNQELQYFKKVTDWYDFIGVIPTTHPMELKDGAVKVSDVMSFVVDDKRSEQAVNLTDTLYWSAGLAADSPEEFLWSYKRIAKADYGNTVVLPFNHQNSLIFLGFSSDKTDTKLIDYVPGTPDIPAVPEVRDTTDTWFNLKRGTNVDGSATRTSTDGGSTYVDNFEIPAPLVAEIKSYYSINNGTAGDYDLHMGNTAWPSAEIRQLRVVKDVPVAYRLPVETASGDVVVFFNALKYLEDNGYKVTYKISGGKPDVFNYPIIDLFVNGTAFTIVGFNFGVANVYDASVAGNVSALNYTIDVTPGTPAVPGLPAIEGIRVFSADSLDVNNLPVDTLYCVHVPHTTIADATISSAGCELSNRNTSDEAITFSLPATTTLSATPVWSPSTFYALPGDTDFNFIVVKLSYVYDGVTAYDVRVPIRFPAGGLVPGKYYKYELYITGTSNGTNDPTEARNEKDEVLIEDNPVISVKLISVGYTQGDERKITI